MNIARGFKGKYFSLMAIALTVSTVKMQSQVQGISDEAFHPSSRAREPGMESSELTLQKHT